MAQIDLVNPPPNLSPQSTLQISQKAPLLLSSTSTPLPWPLSLLQKADTEQQWQSFETLFLSCLRTGDDKSARVLLERLTGRFGDTNERVQAYQTMYLEARAGGDKELIDVLKEMGAVLEKEPGNLPVQKRRIALLRSMGKLPEATGQLVDLVGVSPVDAEAWAELADLYLVQKLYEQAIYCLEEVLLIMPNAWNMQARLGEVIYLATLASAGEAGKPADVVRGVAESMRRFCRSIELCDNYLRGYYGLKLTTKKLLEILPDASRSNPSNDSSYNDLPLPTESNVQKLNELATKKLGEIIRRGSAGESGWDGYDEAELIAARELLDRETISVAR